MNINYLGIVIILFAVSFALAAFFLNYKALMTRRAMVEIGTLEHEVGVGWKALLADFVSKSSWLEKMTFSDRPAMSVKLRRLGYRSRLALSYFGLVKLAAAFALMLVGLMLASLGGGFGLLVLFVGPLIGLYIPDILVDRMVEAKDKRIARDVPDFTDLLNICIRSGMTLSLAIDRVGKGIDRAIKSDLLTISERARMGDTIEDAIETLSASKEISEPTSLALGSIARATKLGIPLGDVIQQSADDLRKRRVDETKADAAKLPVKILIPLMACLLPSVLIVVLGPAILGMIEGFAAL